MAVSAAFALRVLPTSRKRGFDFRGPTDRAGESQAPVAIDLEPGRPAPALDRASPRPRISPVQARSSIDEARNIHSRRQGQRTRGRRAVRALCERGGRRSGAVRRRMARLRRPLPASGRPVRRGRDRRRRALPQPPLAFLDQLRTARRWAGLPRVLSGRRARRRRFRRRHRAQAVLRCENSDAFAGRSARAQRVARDRQSASDRTRPRSISFWRAGRLATARLSSSG